MFRISNTVKHLIIINVLFYVGTISMGKATSFVDLFAMHFPLNNDFQPWQIITHMFMHGGPDHIFFNMLLLWMVGSPMEFALGQKRFIFLYISAGLGGALLPLLIDYFQYYSLVIDIQQLGFDKEVMRAVINADGYSDGAYRWTLIQNEIGPILQSNNVNVAGLTGDQMQDLLRLNRLGYEASLGASGAIFGVLAAFGFIFAERTVYLLIPPIPLKAKYIVFPFIAAEFITAMLTGVSLIAQTNVSRTAHVGGAIVGFLIAWYWKKTQFNKHRWN